MPKGVVGALYRLYFGRVLPVVGGLLSGDPGAYSYLPASVARFPEPKDFAALMAGCGFDRVTLLPLTMGIAYIYRGEAAS
jgi:demethylmenaquinone methyltransferase/2-methoxy-6-polyprenyl-1,4-benzoquinol methylase